MNLFVTGIGTNVGKTVVSAILTEVLQADYWKPIQSGTIEGMDSETVRGLISNSKTVIYPEAYLLKEPLSPHFAAKLENVNIDLEKIKLPVRPSSRPNGFSSGRGVEADLIIEGAGGLLVPINKSQYVIDIAKKIDCEIVLVISNYLGCINHSLLSLNYLLQNNFKIHSLVFNGEFEIEVKEVIMNYVPNCKIIDIPTIKTLSKELISPVAANVKQQMAL